MTGRVKLDRPGIGQDAHVACRVHAPGQDPFAHEGVADIVVLVRDDDPFVIAHAEIAEHGHGHLIDVARIHLLQAHPQRCRAAAEFEGMQIDDPGDAQGLGKMLDQVCLEQVALDHAALARRELADDAEQDRIVAMGDAVTLNTGQLRPPAMKPVNSPNGPSFSR